jgi:hypothetical protein
MTHIAVAEAIDRKSVQWFKQVADEEYLAGPKKFHFDFVSTQRLRHVEGGGRPLPPMNRQPVAAVPAC